MTFRWRSKTKKWQIGLNLFGTILEGKSIGSVFFLKELNEELIIWRTKMQARDQGMVQFKDSVCFKLVQIAYSEFQPWTLAKVGLRATLDKGSGTKSPRTNLKQIEPWMGLYYTSGFRTETMYNYYIVMKSMFLGYKTIIPPYFWLCKPHHYPSTNYTQTIPKTIQNQKLFPKSKL